MKAPARVYYCLQGKGTLKQWNRDWKKKKCYRGEYRTPTVGPPRIANIALVTTQ